MSAPQLVLFDLDGTLVDTAPDLALALNLQRARHGLPPLALEVVRPHASHGSRGLLGIGFGITPGHARFPAMREEYLNLYDQVFTRSPRMFAGMEEVLQALEQAGIRWGVVTNKPRRFTQPLLTAMGLSARAACVVSGDDAARSKPHPDPLLLACALAETAPCACLYVGDAERDIQAGRAAGMHTLVAGYGYLDVHDRPHEWGAAGMIADPRELLELLKVCQRV